MLKRFLVFMSMLMFVSVTFAGYPVNRPYGGGYILRGSNGTYAGRIQPFGNRMNYYNRTGQYSGYARTYGGATRFYSNGGQYQGRITPGFRY